MVSFPLLAECRTNAKPSAPLPPFDIRKEKMIINEASSSGKVRKADPVWSGESSVKLIIPLFLADPLNVTWLISSFEMERIAKFVISKVVV